MEREYKLLVGGEWTASGETKRVIEPYSGKLFGRVHQASAAHVEEAVRKCYLAAGETAGLAVHERARILQEIGNGLIKNRRQLLEVLVYETGKPLREAKEEIARCVATFRAAAEAAASLETATLPAGGGRDGALITAFSSRFPIGTVLGVNSIGFPLNSIARKLGPAIAAGNPCVLYPKPETAATALELASIVTGCGYPAGGLSVLPGDPGILDLLVAHEGIKMVSFTGDSETGWRIKRDCGKKRLLLQLDGLGIALVHSDADLDLAADKCLEAAFLSAGQLESSLQRILVHEDVFHQFTGKFVKRVGMLQTGDPSEAETDMGPVISADAAQRIEEMIMDAVNRGADLVSGGSRHGQVIAPTVFVGTSEDMAVSREQVYGPVVALVPYTDPEQALWTVQDTGYGLQTSLFTNNLQLVMDAYRFLDVGALLVNEAATFRMEHLPYGGIKESGYGRESIQETIRQMTEEKLLVIRNSR